MKRFISILAFLALSVAAFGQGSLLKQTLEIVELEINDGEKEISVFDMPEGDVHQYFFCAGTLGIGDDIIQFNIDPVSELFIPLGDTQHSTSNVYHIFPVLCARRAELRQFLADNGVQTEIHYPIPPHKQQCYKEWGALELPITEIIHAQELSIPCNQALSDDEVNQIITFLNDFK